MAEAVQTSGIAYIAGMIAYNAFLAGLGVTPTTGWRWRRRGWLETTNIAGRQYVSSQQIAKFNERARLGEFSMKHHVPKRKGKL